MKQILFLISFLLSQIICRAQNNAPTIISFGKTIQSFVPKGWKQYLIVKGDLNKDGLEDVAMIMENTSLKNFITNDGLGTDTLNLNPRILLILFQDQNNAYKLAEKNNILIPSANDEVSACLVDPMEEGGLEIKNGVLKISMHYWYSCGSWYVSNNTFTFRFQHNQFELIGYDNDNFHRASGEMTATSINFSTKKKCETSGGNMFNEDVNKPKTTCKFFKINKLKALKELSKEREMKF